MAKFSNQAVTMQPGGVRLSRRLGDNEDVKPRVGT